MMIMQAMWAVLYGYVLPTIVNYAMLNDGRNVDRWTPEIFSTKVRGTACGTASALSRMYVTATARFSSDFY